MSKISKNSSSPRRRGPRLFDGLGSRFRGNDDGACGNDVRACGNDDGLCGNDVSVCGEAAAALCLCASVVNPLASQRFNGGLHA